ncbi:hypothetical protein ACFYUY_29010 [Kitasatospora sp. NPDC004745]
MPVTRAARAAGEPPCTVVGLGTVRDRPPLGALTPGNAGVEEEGP